MWRLILLRFGVGLLTLFVVSILVFLITDLLPGDVAQMILGQSALPDTLLALRKELGLNQSALLRYGAWLANMLQGDMGRSLAGGVPVTSMIGERLSNTLILAALTASISIPLSIFLGLWAAMNPGKLIDRIISGSTMVLVSLPSFLVATVLVMVFAVQLRLLPPIAYMTKFQGFGSLLRSLALPILTLCLFAGALLIRMTRAAVLNVMSLPYIEMSILKGVPRQRIILRHALPNAIGPIANVTALTLAYLVSGVVIVETIFAYPGLAKLMVDAVQVRDMPLIQACAMIFCATYVGLIVLADLFQIMSNPRLRHPK